MTRLVRPASLLASVIVWMAGCEQKPASDGPPRPKAGAYRILALGDSYTIGQSVPEAQRWPVQLAKRLRQRGVDAGEPQIIAQTGWTTDELAAAIDAAKPQGPFDCVTLLIGVNNQYRGRGADAYRGEFAALLDRAIGFAGGDASRVVVVSIPDYGVTPFGSARREKIGREIDAFNAIARDEAARRHAVFVDITPISRGGTTRPALHAEDGLHPSGEQYAAWADAIAEAIAATAKSASTTPAAH
ncbi:MAG TPA: SGNH/GDSL hydrolase family protein [Tepidisphaeraceae bacterium]|jgi:lysophospholipase L1-like esterase